MPEVKGKKYPYTPEGIAAAEEAKGSTFYLKSGNSPLFSRVGSSPVKQTIITDEMRAEKNSAELALNELMQKHGISSDIHIDENSPPDLIAANERFKQARVPFVQHGTETTERAQHEKTGLWKED